MRDSPQEPGSPAPRRHGPSGGATPAGAGGTTPRTTSGWTRRRCPPLPGLVAVDGHLRA